MSLASTNLEKPPSTCSEPKKMFQVPGLSGTPESLRTVTRGVVKGPAVALGHLLRPWMRRSQALTLEPEPEDEKIIKQKLVDGLKDKDNTKAVAGESAPAVPKSGN